MSFAPKSIEDILISVLNTENHLTFAQVATVYAGKPQVRTVHLRYFDEYDTLGFNTHIKSAKWIALKENPFLSGCYYERAKNIQFRWEGEIQLIDGCTREGDGLLNRMWNLTRADVRKAYWLNYSKMTPPVQLSDSDQFLNQRCPEFVSVVCHPVKWDVYQMSEEDYSRDERTIYTVCSGDWSSTRVSTLDGREQLKV